MADTHLPHERLTGEPLRLRLVEYIDRLSKDWSHNHTTGTVTIEFKNGEVGLIRT